MNSNINELEEFFENFDKNIKSAQNEIVGIGSESVKLRDDEESAKLDYLYCYEDTTIEEAAKSMQEQKVRRLIVLDKDKIKQINKKEDQAIDEFLEQKFKDVSNELFKNL